MRIMIVDDSKAMRMIVMRTLRQAALGEHTYLEAENGVQALALLEKSEPDLILCDWNMPELNGIELLKRLEAAGRKVKFGFVTSEADPEMKKLAIAHGALFLISKPFTVETFQAALQPLMSGPIAPGSPR